MDNIWRNKRKWWADSSLRKLYQEYDCKENLRFNNKEWKIVEKMMIQNFRENFRKSKIYT